MKISRLSPKFSFCFLLLACICATCVASSIIHATNGTADGTDTNGATYTFLSNTDKNYKNTGKLYQDYPKLQVQGIGSATLASYAPGTGPHAKTGLTSYAGMMQTVRDHMDASSVAVGNSPHDQQPCKIQLTILVDPVSGTAEYAGYDFSNANSQIADTLPSISYCSGDDWTFKTYGGLFSPPKFNIDIPAADTKTAKDKITVNYNISSGSVQLSEDVKKQIADFPNATIVLTNSTGATSEITTDSRTPVSESVGSTTTQRIYSSTLSGVFGNIPPGDYTVCLKDTTICSKVTKAAGSNATVSISQTVGPNATNNTPSATSSTCQIGPIGWILCPVLTTGANIADGAFTFLSNNFLSTSPNIFTQGQAFNADGSTKTESIVFQAWSVVRTIANVAFVIVFLIIIFSQLTNVGVTNYGIKKMLPKLIIAAVLVNLSYYICQIAVDLSNILGYSLQGVLAGLVPRSAAATFDSGSSFLGITEGIILVGAGIAVVWASLAVLIPAILAAIVALVMILFILIARQAIIILLVILAPLAFVAFLLPNTEKLYKSWQKTLVSMLMLFPIIAVVFGASKLASGILQDVFTSSNNDIGKVAAAALLVLPLFVVPGLLKKAVDGVGKLGATINGLGDKASKGTKNKVANTRALKQLQETRAKNAALIQSGQYSGANPFQKLRAGTHKAFNESKIAGRYGRKELARGASIAEAMDAEDMKLADSQFKSMNLTGDEATMLGLGKQVIRKDRNGRDVVIADGAKNNNLRRSAVKQMVAANDVSGMNKLWDIAAKTSPSDTRFNKIRETFGDSLMASSSKPVYFGAGAIAGMRTGANKGTQDTIISAIDSNAYSAEKMVKADKDELQTLNAVMNKQKIYSNDELEKLGLEIPNTPASAFSANTINGMSNIKGNAQKVQTDPILSASIAKNSQKINDIASGTFTPPPPAP